MRCLKSRTEGINCPFQETVMIKLGDTNITDEGKSKIFPKHQKMTILGQALIAQCPVISLPRQPCCDPEPTVGFSDWKPEHGATALREALDPGHPQSSPVSPLPQSIQALRTKSCGRANFDHFFYHFPSLGCKPLHHCSLELTLCQVQVLAWCLTGSGGCDDDSVPGGTTSCRWA